NYTFTSGDNGTHTFTNSVTLKTAGSQSATLTDTVTSSITGTSSAVSVTAAPVSKLSVTASPTTLTAGNSISLTVTAQDQFGNTATGYRDTAHFTTTDAQATLTTDYTFVAGDNGARTFSLTLKTAGNQTVTATDTVTSSINGTTNQISVSAAGATRLVVTGTP